MVWGGVRQRAASRGPAKPSTAPVPTLSAFCTFSDRVHGKPAAQYESGTLRMFKGGRTDVIRTCSDEAFAFCRSSGSPNERLAQLNAALASHKAYANDAISARGVDRHLFGLKLIAKEQGLPVPEIFSDPGYVASTYFQLSTSNVIYLRFQNEFF